MTHTPGPWVYRQGGATFPPYVSHHDKMERSWTIVELRGRPDADGHLIAAAPDLLAALKAALTETDEPSFHAIAKAAIAKAEGRE